MANENEGPLDITLNISQAKTAVPMVADGHMCRWRLQKLSSVKGEKGAQLKWEYHLIDPAPDSEGGQITPGAFGSIFFENIALYAKPDAKDPKWFEKRIASRVDALLGTGDIGNKKNKPVRPDLTAETVSNLIGKELVAKMKVRTGDFIGNEFGSVYFPGDIAA